MGDYDKAAAGVRSTAQTGSAGSCCVAGCILPGALSTATQGTNEWFCRLHFNAKYADHGKITAHAANREKLYRIAFWCINKGPAMEVPRRLKDVLLSLGRGDILDSESAIEGRPLTVRTLGANLFQVLDAECAGDRKTEKPKLSELIEKKRDTWSEAADLLSHSTEIPEGAFA